MGFEDTYSKRLRMNRTLANEFKSCRQFFNGKITSDNDELRDLVINNAIEHSLKTEGCLLKTLTDLCEHSRLNGSNVPVNIKTENWEKLVLVLGRVKRWGKLDEWDLIEHCLKVYLNEIKLKGKLP